MIVEALISLRPGENWSLNGDSYDDLVWNDSTTKPSRKEVETEIERLQQNAAINTHRAERRKEYPSIQEQLDMIYWDNINGTDNWKSMITSIKEKYPKS